MKTAIHTQNRHIANPNDLRVIKTKENIRLSFFELLDSYHYDDIAIAHILKKAQINRTTFYKHYANKHDLAAFLIQEFIDELFMPLVQKYAHQSFLDSLQSITLDLENHADLVSTLWKIDTPKVSLKQLTKKIIAEQYIQRYHTATDSQEKLGLQGDLYASFILSLIESLINDDSVCPDDLFKNARVMLDRVLGV